MGGMRVEQCKFIHSFNHSQIQYWSDGDRGGEPTWEKTESQGKILKLSMENEDPPQRLSLGVQTEA